MKFLAALALAATLSVAPTAASAFEFTFTWEGLSLCTSGNARTVPNPPFSLSNVPAGTAAIVFKMVDLQVRSYNHGGGTAPYTGSNTIQPGAFTYKSPCPPNGAHTYRWTASAVNASRQVLATATSDMRYP